MSTPEPIKKGQFYFIHDTSDQFIMEDKTKLGLEVKDILTQSMAPIARAASFMTAEVGDTE